MVIEFMEPGCGPCKKLLPMLARWQASLAARVTIVVVSTGSAEDVPIWEEHGVRDVLITDSSDVFKAFRIRSTPSAVAIDPDGTVASAPAGGLHMPEVLIRSVIRRTATTQPPGTRAPAMPKVLQIDAS